MKELIGLKNQRDVTVVEERKKKTARCVYIYISKSFKYF